MVVDDERRLVELIIDYLAEVGIEAEGCFDGRAGLAAARRQGTGAVILDLMLPVIGGLEVCRRLRAEGNRVPILMLSARGAVTERVAGLEAGADDYLIKPFALEELVARLRVIERRAETSEDEKLTFGDLVVDVLSRRSWCHDQELDLARREFDVLASLIGHAGRVVSRGFLLDEVWRGDVDIRSNAIDVRVSRLRAHLQDVSDRVTITTVRGVGYRLELRDRAAR
ncbi:MAG: response regulator mprA [Aeromicrobium sp.]|nr:response regulator mprA [Aeromicrobium sp.]